MLKHVEMDPSVSLASQFKDTSGEPIVLVNLFDVDPKDHEAFKEGWLLDAEFFKVQPGYVSSQLHQGIGGSSMFLNYAVFETAPLFGATNDVPAFKPLRKVYPDSATAHPHLFRPLAIPGICVSRL